jgi:hypothetical protein
MLTPPAGGAGPGTTTALAFATIIPLGSAFGTSCAIAPVTSVPATFFYQTTNPATNEVTGTPNTPAMIGGPLSNVLTFVIGFTPTAAFAPTDVVLGFTCGTSLAAPSISGLNTLLLSASATPTPDVIALAATPSGNGFLTVPVNGSNAFAVATVNVGAGGVITVAADTGSATLPLTLTLCQTNPATGSCLATPAATVTTTINTSATPSFGIFATASAAIKAKDDINRIFVRLKDAGGAVRGLTSVAVAAQ